MFISNNGEKKTVFFFLLVKLTRQNYVDRAQIEAKEKYKGWFCEKKHNKNFLSSSPFKEVTPRMFKIINLPSV